jgi:nucleoid DNA-binding protein
MAKKKAKAAKSAKAGKAATAAAPKPTKISPASKVRTKGEIYNAIAGNTGMPRKQVVSVFSSLEALLSADLSKKGPGVVQVPGLMKVMVKRMPATKAREGINPFTKEKTIFKAKPARNVVKVRPMRGLKKMV